MRECVWRDRGTRARSFYFALIASRNSVLDSSIESEKVKERRKKINLKKN